MSKPRIRAVTSNRTWVDWRIQWFPKEGSYSEGACIPHTIPPVARSPSCSCLLIWTSFWRCSKTWPTSDRWRLERVISWATLICFFLHFMLVVKSYFHNRKAISVHKSWQKGERAPKAHGHLYTRTSSSMRSLKLALGQLIDSPLH